MKIACAGDNCIDQYDDTGERFPGGNPVNVAVYIRRLGGCSAYLGAVGQDDAGRALCAALADKGVDISHVQHLPGTTAVSHVRRVHGERVFGDYDEGVMADFQLRPEDIRFLSGFDLVVTSLWGHTEAALPAIQGAGIPIAFDGAERPLDLAGLRALPWVDVAFFSDDLSDDNALQCRIREVAAFGPRIVVAMRGSRGSLAYDGQHLFHCGIVPCTVVDTMGAGDSFIAGFLTAWLSHRPIPDCLCAGAENAAVTIAYPGAW